jgi:hypothetical protein
MLNRQSKLWVVMMSGLLACGLSGCGTGIITAEQPDRLAATPYPKAAPLGDDLDILIIRHGWDIQLVNRTPRSYRDVQLWLNQQYVGDVNRIQIGAQNSVPLSDFVNSHREAYPVGGFLDPDRGYPLVLAELFTPTDGKRHRLLVRLTNAPTDVAEFD